MLTKNGNGPQEITPAIEEIKLAHDMLALVLSGAANEEAEFNIELSEQTKVEMLASHHVLCWILGHNNTAFADNMKQLEQALKDEGIEVIYDVDDNDLEV